MAAVNQSILRRPSTRSSVILMMTSTFTFISVALAYGWPT
jgi:hypothetical protein